MSDMFDWTILELSNKLRKKELSPVELLSACLATIETTEPKLNAYVRVFHEDAMRAARQAELDIFKGDWRGALHGIPVSLKDVCDIQGIATTASSRVRADWLAPTDSAVVTKLRVGGAVIVGKTQTHEFAYGAKTPGTHNPWNVDRISGGSSGGSAVTVATGGAYMAIGTDTAGSIRIPASLCGVVGLKPTYGRISRFGITPLSWSLDHVGPLTRCVSDAAQSLSILSGYDARDPGSVNASGAVQAGLPNTGLAGIRVGRPINFFFDHIDPEVEAAVDTVYKELEALGASLVEVEIPMVEQITAVKNIIMLSEASAYHKKMHQASPDLYSDDVAMLIEAGKSIAAVDYIQALRLRAMINEAVGHLFHEVDVIVAPTVPRPAVHSTTDNIIWDSGLHESLNMCYTRFTILANVAGLPALSIPCGFTGKSLLPIGCQIIGRSFEEDVILHVGSMYEKATGWKSTRPVL